MSRPGFTLTVDERSGSTLVISGTRLRMQRFPLGTQLVYPADSEPLTGAVDQVVAALEAPTAQQPLADRLTPATRLTVVVGDGALPRPAMRDDVRRTAVEQVLEQAARAGVRDVAVLVATGLRRRLSEGELTAMLGERVVRSFDPHGALLNHDVTADDLVAVGDAAGGGVRVNPRLAASDLVVNVFVRGALAGEADDQMVLGLTDADTIDRVNGLDGSAERRAEVAALVHTVVPVLTLDIALGNPQIAQPLAFASHREWNWSLADKAAFNGVQQALRRLPKQTTQRVFGGCVADYPVLAVGAGEARAASEASRAAWLEAHRVPVARQADVLVVPVWGRGSDPTAPAGDPLFAAHNALVTQGTSVGEPALREGGVFIGMHPLKPVFSTRHHGAASDFFAEVLSQTTDPVQIRDRFQQRFATDGWYLDLYRNQQAYHPLHTFHRWYATAAAASHCSEVVWVGADRASAARMGFRAASTLDDALELASGSVGRTPVITALRSGAQVAMELS